VTEPANDELAARPLEPSGIVAAFDFDGTIARRDSLVPFMVALCGAGSVARAAVRHGPRSLQALASGGGRDSVKARFFAELLTGRELSAVQAAGLRYAEALRSARRLRGDVLARWQWHRRQGHDTVIVSASLDAYLRPFGATIGATAVIATTLETDEAGRLTGRMVGGNCRGPEKAVRLARWLEDRYGDRDVELWAYGDSTGDRELLAMAQTPHLLVRNGHLPTPPPGTAWLGRLPA
jgi:phosphatidylglycerophosphatase C